MASDNNNKDPQIYLLPNLMTAGNLFCGFAAILTIIHAKYALPTEARHFYTQAIGFIFGACIFDLLDGRVARLANQISDFGKEFDSVADVVSFGVAPALLVYQIVLVDFEKTGWLIAFVYLLCGAMRLARFNCFTPNDEKMDFLGVPIPAAAGVIASITLFIMAWDANEKELGVLKHILPFLMLLLSFLMFSKFRYPSFKYVNWRSKFSILLVMAVIFGVVFTVLNYTWMPALVFVIYMLSGPLMPVLKHLRNRKV